MADKVFKPIIRKLPVIFNNDHAHVMARAELFHTPGKILIQITGEGPEIQPLVEFLELDTPIAISLLAVPVKNITDRKRNV